MGKSKQFREFRERIIANRDMIDNKIEQEELATDLEDELLEEEDKRLKKEYRHKDREEALAEINVQPTEEELRAISLEELEKKYPKHCNFACAGLWLYFCDNEEFKKELYIECILSGANEGSLKRNYISALEAESQVLEEESLATLQDRVVLLGSSRLKQEDSYYEYREMNEIEEREYCIGKIMKAKFGVDSHWKIKIEEMKEEIFALNKERTDD